MCATNSENSVQNKNTSKWCFAWYAKSLNPIPGTEKAVMVKNTKWPAGSSISISFLDGDPLIQSKVKTAALKWISPGHANLSFEFRTDTTKTDIRISFQYEGSWSALGTTCKKITDLNEPTMNFGWLDRSTTQEELERVVLHEFGHALGLTHEHMSPVNGIKWNRDKVVADLSGPPNNWSIETIENNLFKTYAANETNYTQFDPTSIMMYPIPEEWTTDNFSVTLNSKLSNEDISFIKQEYP